MASREYRIDINAPKQKVWDIMLGEQSYQNWTEVFQPGSRYEGSWEQGSEIRFIDGSGSGLIGKITEATPPDYVNIEYTGLMGNNQPDTTSEEAKRWAGAHESYRLEESGSVTTVKVEISGEGFNEDETAMLDNGWPQALSKIKQMVESA